MKKFEIMSFSLILGFVSPYSFAASPQCETVTKSITETAVEHTKTVTKCLNKYSPGLAGQLENLVYGYHSICDDACADFPSYQDVCDEAVDTVAFVKSIASSECTN